MSSEDPQFDRAAAPGSNPSPACERATQIAMEALYGEADPAAVRELEDHLSTCAACAAAFADRRAALQELELCPAPLALAEAGGTRPATPAPASSRHESRRVWRWIAAAALLLSLAGGAAYALETRWRAALHAERTDSEARFERRLALEIDAVRRAWSEALLLALHDQARSTGEGLRTLAADQRDALRFLDRERLEQHEQLRAAIAELATFTGYARAAGD